MLNQVPREGNNLSPWELMFNKKLPANYLKPVGSLVIYLANRLQKGRKFNEKGLEGVLIGFNPGFHSYLILSSSGCIVETKHVQFLKDSLHNFPFFEPPGTDLFSQTSTDSRESDFSSVEKQYTIQESQNNPSESESDQEDKALVASSSPDPPLISSQTQTPESSISSISQMPKRETQKPQRYGFHHYYKPPSYKAAKNCSEWPKWKKAADDELNSI